jgi:hypothetical protein
MHGLAQIRESINLPVSIELFDHEHSSPRAFLLCGQAWRNCGRCAQDAVRNSATGRERTNRQARGSSRREIIQSKAVFSSSGGSSEFIKPFFDDVDKVAGRIRGASLQLRIAAPSVVLYDYVPELLQRVRRRFPSFRLQLHEAVGADAERLLLAGDTDLAITIVDGKRRPEIHSRPLLELPLILLVNKKQLHYARATAMGPGQNRRNANHISAW